MTVGELRGVLLDTSTMRPSKSTWSDLPDENEEAFVVNVQPNYAG